MVQSQKIPDNLMWSNPHLRGRKLNKGWSWEAKQQFRSASIMIKAMTHHSQETRGKKRICTLTPTINDRVTLSVSGPQGNKNLDNPYRHELHKQNIA